MPTTGMYVTKQPLRFNICLGWEADGRHWIWSEAQNDSQHKEECGATRTYTV
jgi:hypothetical protein